MVAAGPLAAPRRAAALAAAVALAATGCGVLKSSEPEAIAQPGTVTTESDGLSPGPYALTTEEGAVITFDLPTVPAPDDRVEQLRRDLNVEPVTYVELHIDNTEGVRTVQIDDLKVISHEGGQFPFEPVAQVLSDWDPNRSGEGGFWRADGSPLDPDQGARLDARTHELIDRYTGAVPVGTTGRELMVGDFEKLPRSFDDIELSPYPNDRAQGAAPVGHGPAQRQYRAEAPNPAQRQDRAEVPNPAPRQRVEAEPPAAPAPAAPDPARPAAQPPRAPAPAEPAPAPGPEPVYTPDCADPAQPSGPVQQAAWNAVCAPVPEPPPAPGPVQTPLPGPGPTPDPAPVPAPTPTQPATGTAGNNGQPPEQGGATAGATPSPAPSSTGRRNWPPRTEPSPTPTSTPTPTPTAPTPAPSSSTTTGPSSSLPSRAELA